MIKVAIVTKKMVIGGTEKALLPMLKQFDSEKFVVDLYLQELGGALYDEIPSYVNVIKMPIFSELTLFNKFRQPFYFFKAILNRLQINSDPEYYLQCERACKCMPRVKKEYDIAISYHAPDAVPFFYVINNLYAKKKIMWLHFDVEKTNAVNDTAKKYFSCYDKIFAVSEQSKNTFDRNYPEMAGKTEVFYNLVDTESIRKKATLGPTYNDVFSGIRILSIGRLDEQKGYDLLVPVIKKLLDENYDIKCYICGDGNQYSNLKRLIIEKKVENNFLLLGMQSNPYGYLKDCDVYVQPSRNEGYCTTTNEARMFYKPILVTDVCGMREQITDHVNGTIVDLNTAAIYKGLKELLDHPELRKAYSEQLQELDLNRTIDIERLL